MTTPNIKVKVQKKPTLRLKVLPRFPANVAVSNFLTVTKTSATYTFGVDYTQIGLGTPTALATSFVPVLDQAAGIYKLMALSAVAGGTPGGTNGQFQVNVSGVFGGVTFSGDATVNSSGVLTLATVNSNVGSFGSATATATFTVDGKGRLTAAGSTTVTPAIGSVTGLGAGVSAFLATPSSANLRAALTDEVGTGAAYFVGGALGTPASGTATNLTGLPLSGLVAQAANTIVANATGSSAVPTAVDISALTTKGTPTSSDWLLISDQAASGAMKKAAFPTGSAGATNVVLFSSTGCVGNGTTDDTTNFQTLLTNNPSNVILDGQGKTYKITSAVTIPASSLFMTIQNATFTVTGDINFLSVASGVANFTTIENVTINASGQTTTGRRNIDVSRMAQYVIRNVWINGTANKSYGVYGTGTGGVSPYYGLVSHCYMGNINIGIMFDDNATPSAGVNSNSIEYCRIQPQTGNFGIYLGQNSQNINVWGCDLESTGGTGIYMDGTGHCIDGTRFESQTTGISVQTNATNYLIGYNYYSSNTAHVAWAGSSRLNGTILYDPTATNTATFQNGIISKSPSGGIGYGTGAGGTVTQITSRSTSVTLNKTSGQITLVTATPTLGAWVFFTVINSTVSATDTVHIVGQAGSNAYLCQVFQVAAGSFQVGIQSTVSAVSDTPVFNFTVFKGVNS